MSALTTTPRSPRDTRAAAPVRVQNSMLSGLEKRLLLWLAARMPHAVNSDHLTLLALVSMLGAGLAYWLASFTPAGLLLVILFLGLNWFGDSLDGTLARVRGQQRPRYGYYVDHVVDAFGALFLFGGLALSGYMSPGVAAVLLISYFLVCLEVYLAACSVGRFQMSVFSMGPTELRLALAVGNLVLFLNPTASAFGGTVGLFDAGGVLGAVGLLATCLYSVVRNTRELYRAEPLPPHRSGGTTDGPTVPVV